MQYEPAAGVIETDIPARLDRLPWARFHTLVVLALGEEVDERDDGDDRDRDDGGRLRKEPHDRDEHARRLRRREDP